VCLHNYVCHAREIRDAQSLLVFDVSLPKP
jgi:hypothetical protein